MKFEFQVVVKKKFNMVTRARSFTAHNRFRPGMFLVHAHCKTQMKSRNQNT